MSIDSLIAISNALSVSTDAILFGEITYAKEPYYRGCKKTPLEKIAQP